jgi:hypothetical protein
MPGRPATSATPGGSGETGLGLGMGLPTMAPAKEVHPDVLVGTEASPSLVYGARLLSGFRVDPRSCVRIALPPPSDRFC